MEVFGNIDQLVQSLVFQKTPWDLTKMQPYYTKVQASHQTYTYIDITGSGLLVAFRLTTGWAFDMRVQVDGGDIFQARFGIYKALIPFLLPFKSSLKVTADVNVPLSTSDYYQLMVNLD